MNYNNFIQEVLKGVSERLGDEYCVSLKKILKNNSVELDSLMITKADDLVVPNIYLNSYYLEMQAGHTLEDIICSILEVYDSCRQKLDKGGCFEIRQDNSSEKVILKLVNYGRNIELLKDSPHVKVEDLAVTFHYLASDNEEGIGTVRITNKNADTFNINRETLLEDALRNTVRLFPYALETMLDVLVRIAEKSGKQFDGESLQAVDELREMSENREGEQMYVLTNNHGMYGAGCLLYENVLKRIYDELGEFFIIPCSVNELIIIPGAGEQMEDNLNEMVNTVNRDHVYPEEVLSDRVYHYPDNSFELSEVRWGIEEA